MKHERITVEDVQVGDRIARTRTGEFGEVVEINEGATTRRLFMERVEDFTYETSDGRTYQYEAGSAMGNIRPRRSAKLWRLVEAS